MVSAVCPVIRKFGLVAVCPLTVGVFSAGYGHHQPYTAGGLNRYDNFVNKVNVANELLQFRSKKLMREVVSRVHADISYQIQDGLRRNELFTRSPIAVRFIDATPERSVAFTVIPKNEKKCFFPN